MNDDLTIGRRLFLGGLLGATLPATLARAQTAERVRRVGFMGNLPPSHAFAAPFWRIFQEELHARGWREGHNLLIEARWAEGRVERFIGFADELVGLNLDLIVTVGSEATDAARKKTGTIPIVMVGPSHPVEAGFVASLARPGGNITGVTNLLNELVVKHLELLKELKPGIERVGVLWSPNNPGSALGFKTIEGTGPRFGLAILSLPIAKPEDLDAAFATILRARPQALHVHPTRPIGLRAQQIASFAVEQKLPTISASSGFVRAGHLASYGADLTQTWRRASFYVDRILRGTKPAELPVEQPTKFEFIINMKTARAIGMTIPQSILLRADEVIE